MSSTNKQGIEIHTQEEFEGMRKAGKLAAEVLDMISEHVKPGVTTSELNDLCHDFIIKNGATPAPLNYKGFPKSVCTSVNHVVCHGIPDDKKLREGDCLNIDTTVIVDGWHGDTSRMFWVGKKIPVRVKRLTQVTYEAMMSAIEIVKPGVSLYEIGGAIQDIAEKNNFSIVKDYCGHGIGKFFHGMPNVLHYRDGAGKRVILEEGMFFTIEPMLNFGKAETILSSADGWTVTTRDKSLSAQFEHTIGVTSDGFEIFTKSPKDLDKPPYK
jgi:methionyl aminopeptidase